MDEGRWLRPSRRAWLGGWNVMIVLGCWIFAPIAVLIESWLWKPGRPPPESKLFQWGVLTPLMVLGYRLAHWSVCRSLTWHVDATGVAIYRHGAVVHQYAWSRIRGIGPESRDAVRILVGDERREHRLGLVTIDDVRWFREFARDRIAERPEANLGLIEPA